MTVGRSLPKYSGTIGISSSAMYAQISSYLVNYSFQIIGAIIVGLIGLVVARKVGLVVEHQMVKHRVDVTLSRFTGSGVKILVLAMFFVILNLLVDLMQTALDPRIKRG